MRTHLIFFILVIFSLSFASIIWTLPLGFSSQKTNAVTTKPVLFDNNLVFTSQEGYVYMVSPSSGKSLWTKSIGGYPKQPVIFEGNVVVASSNGNIVSYKKDGLAKWNISAGGYVYGLAVGDKLYATTSKGVIAIDKAGNIEMLYNLSKATYTAPATNGKYIIFGTGDILVAIRPNKQIEWTKQISAFWKSNPVIDAGMIFIGALDNNLYAFDIGDGFFRWKVETKGWVMSTPYAKDGNIYFGSNDGYIYSVEEADGKLRWKVATKEAVQSTPIMGSMGGKDAIFAGSNDNTLYAIDDQTGKVLWKQPTKGWVNSPILIGKAVIFGSHDGTIYSVSTERACTIEYPEPDSLVAYKEIYVKGKAFSEYGNARAYVRVNEGGWEEVQVENESWNYLLDPNLYPFGLVRVECKINDPLSEEKAPYTSLSIVRTENAPNEKMNVVFPSSVQEGKEFNVSVLDEKGIPVINFEATFQGKTYKGSGQVVIKAVSGGSGQKLVISKPGFNTTTLNMDVSTGTGGVWVTIGIVVVALAAVLGYYKIIMKK